MNRFKQNHRQNEHRTAGVTLVEVIITLGVSTFIIAGILSFYIQFYKIGFVNEQRNRINRDVRQLTGELSRIGRQSNYFTIYRSSDPADHNDASDRRLDGSSGDMLVFVNNDDSNTGAIQSITGFFRDTSAAGPDGTGPVRRFELEFSPVTYEPVEKLIPSAVSLAASPEVIELSRGLSDGRLFYNFWGRSIMVNGQIYHGNAAKRVTETYNFTISPRG